MHINEWEEVNIKCLCCFLGDVENARNEDIEAAAETQTSEEDDVPAYIPDPLAPVFRRCRIFRPGVKVVLTALLNTCLILFVILIALSVQKLDYDEVCSFIHVS